MLLENDLIEYKEENQIFKITEKGMHFLQLYSQVGELISANNEIDKETNKTT